MYKSLYIILFLFAASGVQAQQLPERSLVRKGNRQYNKGNYEQSAGRYEQALQAAPGQFEAIYNLGNALYKAERFDRAEQTMQQAAADSLRADTERAEAFYNLGNAQFKQQKYQEALESYKQSLRLNPSDMEAKYNYAYTKRLLDENKDGGGGGGPQRHAAGVRQALGKERHARRRGGHVGRRRLVRVCFGRAHRDGVAGLVTLLELFRAESRDAAFELSSRVSGVFEAAARGCEDAAPVPRAGV